MEDNTMIGCEGNTYSERKINLLHQFGYHDVTEDIFEGMSEIQIDNKVRSIIANPPVGYRM